LISLLRESLRCLAGAGHTVPSSVPVLVPRSNFDSDWEIRCYCGFFLSVANS